MEHSHGIYTIKKHELQCTTVGRRELISLSIFQILHIDFPSNSIFLRSWTPSVEWDSNWDHRQNTSIVKPVAPNSPPEKINEYNKILEENRSKATRHLILIRHGQYNLDGATDIERTLTELGRSQAKLTGERLRDLKIPIDEVVISTMTRAQETAQLILEEIPEKEIIKISNDSLIAEGAPIEPGNNFNFL